jgi:hypothetical protein
MRTQHIVMYLALAVGVVVAVALATASGLWLDHYVPLGSRGILVFLGTAAAIIVVTETIAGFFGDQIDHWLQRRRLAR